MIDQCGTLEISRSRLRHNLELLQKQTGPQTILCATIKANAYGHGLTEIANLLKESGIRWAAVYSLGEALELAAFDFDTLVLAPLVLNEKSVLPPHFQNAAAAKIRVNITDAVSGRRLSAMAVRCGVSHPIHLQIDTGLTRMGVDPDNAAALAQLIASLPGLHLEGIFAHFSHGDVPGDPTVAQQLGALQQIAAPLKEKNPGLLVHMQNSGGTFHLQNAGLDMVRIGIALYGLQPSMADPIPGLLPIARLIAPILAIHDRPAGTGVGYGHTFRTSRPSRLAVMPVGYAEGYPRLLSNRSIAQVKDQDVPIVGRISMDQIILDITDVPGVQPGEPVTVISWEPHRSNALDRMAQAIGTIGYELATHLGSRLKRVIVD